METGVRGTERDGCRSECGRKWGGTFILPGVAGAVRRRGRHRRSGRLEYLDIEWQKTGKEREQW